MDTIDLKVLEQRPVGYQNGFSDGYAKGMTEFLDSYAEEKLKQLTHEVKPIPIDWNTLSKSIRKQIEDNVLMQADKKKELVGCLIMGLMTEGENRKQLLIREALNLLGYDGEEE